MIECYRAIVDCRAGGGFRKAGDVFSMSALENHPPFLEVVKGDAEPNAGAAKKAPQKPNAGATKKDLGIGEATSSADVSSVDMVKK